MTGNEFAQFRKRLEKTQKQMANLLGTSLKAIHSYEQGWRTIPAHAERQILFLVSRLNTLRKNRQMCWEIKDCPEDRKRQCPAWEFQSGELCWFINGTLCEGRTHPNWQEKMKSCRPCSVFRASIQSTVDD